MERPQLYTPDRGIFPIGSPGSLRLPLSVAVPVLLLGTLIVALLIFGERPFRELALPTVLALPVGVVGLAACIRRPAAMTLVVFALVGAAGSLRALTPIDPEPIADLALAGLWIGVLIGHLGADPERRRVWLWPALLAPAVYLALSAVQILAAPTLSIGLDAFKFGSWHILAVLLIALAPWPTATLRRISNGLIIIVIGLGLYWLYRYFAGQAQEEIDLALQTLAGQTDVRFQGSLPAAPQLALFGATVAPFGLAAALGNVGRWRILGLIAFALATFGVLASEVRTGTIALTLGVSLTLLLFLFARGFPGGRRSATFVAMTLLVAAVGLAGYSVAISGSPDAEDRFSGVFDPFAEKSFNTRLDRWNIALGEVSDEPLGIGLGTTGRSAAPETFDPSIPLGLDSSYVKVAVEQGIPMMILFVLALISLLLGLAIRGATTTDPVAATSAIGGAGTLLAMSVLMFSGYYVDRPQALAAWVIVGLAAAHFTTAWRPPENG